MASWAPNRRHSDRLQESRASETSLWLTLLGRVHGARAGRPNLFDGGELESNGTDQRRPTARPDRPKP